MEEENVFYVPVRLLSRRRGVIAAPRRSARNRISARLWPCLTLSTYCQPILRSLCLRRTSTQKTDARPRERGNTSAPCPEALTADTRCPSS